MISLCARLDYLTAYGYVALRRKKAACKGV